LRPVWHRHPVRRDEVQRPQEGERFSSENLEALRDRDSEGPAQGPVLAPDPAKPVGGVHAWCEDVAARGYPWRGHEAQGRHESDRSFGRQGTTDSRGGQSPEGGRGSARLGSADPFEPTPGGLGGPRGLTRAAGGETFEGQIPRALPAETCRRGFGGNKASRGSKPWRRSVTGPGQARVMSLPDSANAVGTGTLERRALPQGSAQVDSVILRRGAKASEGSAESFN